MSDSSLIPLAYSVKNAANVLGCSTWQVYNLIYKGIIKAPKIGGMLRIPASEIDRLLGEAVR